MRLSPKLLSVLVSLWLTPWLLSAGDVYKDRAGLTNAFRTYAKRAGGEDRSRIIFFGGSITAGAGASKPEFCYRELLQRHIIAQFPKTPIIPQNAAIGGTGSWLGAFRCKADVLDHWVPADLVIVEFAVNDGGSPEQQVYASMEGIVRQIRQRNPNGDILFVYTLAKNHMDAFKKGEWPERMQWHEKIAEHYGIPSVNMAQYCANKIIAGELTFEDFAKDGVHPTDKGYALYMEALKPFIDKWIAEAAKSDEIKKHELPKPYSPAPMDRAKMIHYDRASYGDGWKVGQDSPVDKFLSVVACDTPGGVATLKFKGDRVGFYDTIGPDTGDIDFSIDGGEWQTKANFDQWCKTSYRAHYRVLAEGLEADKEHELRLRVAEKQPGDSKGRFIRIGYFLVNGEVADPYAGMPVLEKIDKIYATIPPVKYTPAPDRWQFIPNTIKRLQEGPELRIVMLGDSIVNDTNASQFDKLMERMYPKCKITKIVSVRGSTGCWWYKEDNRVEEWVLKHKPDLLMIGGISQRDDVESIREVIKQVRAKQQPEILLMSGAEGVNGDPRKNKEWTFEIDPNSKTYRANLQKMAAEEKCEFLDMTGPHGQYIKDSNLSYGWFMRDPVHGNDRGFQILGRILEKYFAPK